MDPVILQLIQVVVSALGVVVTAVGFGFAVWHLQKEYRWRRRQYAVNMLGDWNGRVVVHRVSIEAAFPGLMDPTDKKRHREARDTMKKRAEEIYLAVPTKR